MMEKTIVFLLLAWPHFQTLAGNCQRRLRYSTSAIILNCYNHMLSGRFVSSICTESKQTFTDHQINISAAGILVPSNYPKPPPSFSFQHREESSRRRMINSSCLFYSRPVAILPVVHTGILVDKEKAGSIHGNGAQARKLRYAIQF